MRHFHDEISNECQNEDKQRFYGLSKTSEVAKLSKLYLLQICFVGLSGTELKVSLNAGNLIGHSVTVMQKTNVAY